MKHSYWVRAVSLCAALAWTAGCGQKGALYLPDHNGSVVTRPANSGPANSSPAGTPPAPKKSTDGQDDTPAPK